MSLLDVRSVSKNFAVEHSLFSASTSSVRALDNVSCTLEPGTVLGILGESGSGKTTLGKIICGLIEPDSGSVFIDGKTRSAYTRQELSSAVQMIFQDPYASLNPKLSVATILSEAVLAEPEARRNELIAETLATVGLSTTVLTSYAHQFSGGQRQRIAIARALLKRPRIIVADEPLSALDITIQNQLLNLFLDIRQRHDTAFIFISHDVVTTANLADRIIVMNQGRIVEEGTPETVVRTPKSPYTRRLIEAVPQFV